MVLNRIGSKSFVVNLLADFIINKLGKNSSSKIQVVDCENFFVVKGKTNNTEILDLSKIIPEFLTEFKSNLADIKITNTIDLIEYDCKLEEVNQYEIDLYDTTNCTYSPKQINNFESTEKTVDNNLVTVSEFPHGYSLNQGRLLYYFLKKIFYSIPSNYITKHVTLNINTKKENEDIINFYDNLQNESDNILKSAILDCVDFNLEKLELAMVDSDWYSELITPLEEHESLRNERFDIVII